MVRTPCCDKSGLKKGTWTPEEDRKLIAYVTRYGCWNWRQLPKFAGLARCGKSCRLRWLNYLRPNVRRGNYTPEEEETIIKLHQKLGSRWSAIAAELPGRTDNDIKNYWHTNLKKRIHPNSGTHEKSAKLISKSKEDFQVESCRQENETVPMPVNNGPFDQIGDSCPLSPLSSSGITTEITAASNELNLLVEDEFAFLEAYVDANFWTDPYVADIFCDPTEIVSLPPSIPPSDYFTNPSCDAQPWTQNNLYDQYTGLF